MKKFIILIPVLNGELTLPYTLKTCCNQNYDDYQIVISNNWSDDRTDEVIQRFQDQFPKITCIKPPRRLGMSAHWEFAIGEVIKDDAFLIIIGSDDALMPNALRYANGLFNVFNRMQALAWSLSYYYYPDLPDETIANNCSLFLGRSIEIRNALLWLKYAADNKAFYHLGLINVYHGFVHTSLLRSLKIKSSGKLINSLSPDIHLSLALCTIAEEFIFIREPLSLNCISNNSTGFSGFSPVSDGKISSNFYKENEHPIHRKLLDLPDLSNAHLDCLLQIHDLGLLPADIEINIKGMLGRAAVSIFINYHSHPKFHEYIEKIRFIAVGFGIERYIEDVLNLVKNDPSSLPSKIDLTFFNEPYSYCRKLPTEIVANCYQASLLAQEIIIADENARRLTLNHVVQRLNDAVRDNHQKKTIDAMNDFTDRINETHGSIWTDREFLTAYLKHVSFRQPPFDPTGFIGALSKDSVYSEWLAKHLLSYERCHRLCASIDAPDLLPTMHILLIPNNSQENLLAKTIDDLAIQVLANWRLTIFSEQACPDPQFASSTVLEWIQTPSSQQTDAIAVVVKASPAEWFICAPMGLRLSPAFTLIAGLRITNRPNTLLLYADEDVINAEGEHSQPKLKPDANLEFLRSTPYIGAATLIHKSLMLDSRIALLPFGLSRNYGAALLAIERGLAAVDHLDEILVHVPDILVEEYAGTALARLLVQQHLARCGVTAEVGDGPLPGTLFIDYQLPVNSPMVSIVLPVQNPPDRIHACLESLLEKTDYPNFEILLIAHNQIEPVVQTALSEKSKHNSRVRILRYSQKYSDAAANNFAARQAQGEFLLLLDKDVVISQENWLTRLAAIGVCKDVGVVGCRLVSPDQKIKNAGLILGLGSIVGPIGSDLPMTEPGYMGRAQLTQDFSAVSAACMLVRKCLFLAVNGFDEKNFPNSYYDADLCIRLGERGYRTVWTPFVTLTQTNNDANAKSEDSEDSADALARKAFIKKWLPLLGNDPAYNRHLSLRQNQWMIDGDFDVPWHPDFESLPRIVAQPPDEMGVGQYRMIGPLKALTDGGRISSFLLPPLNSEKRFLPFLSELSRVKPTVLFFQNAFTQLQTDDLRAYAELAPDIFRVFGQDDIVFSIPQKSAARKHFGKDTKARVRKAVSLCHRAIVTTEPIAEAMRGMVDDIRVVPNYLERSRWGDLQPPRKERRKLRVGWAGAQQHQGDLEFILPVVEATANEVDWIFMGLCPPKLRYHVAEAHNAVPFDQYPVGVAALDLDLAIAPLEINRFNVAKSNLRLLEYGAIGYPVICTDIEPYRNAPVTRVPNNSQAWIDAIRAHVHEIDATRVAGEQLREWVLSNWMLDQHLDDWMKALLPD